MQEHELFSAYSIGGSGLFSVPLPVSAIDTTNDEGQTISIDEGSVYSYGLFSSRCRAKADVGASVVWSL